MKPFDYVRADGDRRRHRGRRQGATFIAGGTNLLDLMKLEVMAPDTLVDITRLDLDGIDATEDGGLRIGALVTNSDLAADPRVRRDYPVLSRALLAGASGPAAQQGHDRRQPAAAHALLLFLRHRQPCNKREPGTGCARHRRRATASTPSSAPATHCIATHPSDMAVALRALDAEVEIRGAGRRAAPVPLGDFYRLPGDTPQLETALAPGELITAVDPAAARGGPRRSTARCATAPPTPSRWSRSRPWCGMEDGRIARRRARLRRPRARALARRRGRGGAGRRGALGRAVRHAPPTCCWPTREGQGGNDFKIPLARRTLTAVLREATDTECRHDRAPCKMDDAAAAPPRRDRAGRDRHRRSTAPKGR